MIESTLPGLLVMPLALAVDLIFGEPPTRVHPVVWMGQLLKFAQSKWHAVTPHAQVVEGALWWLLGAVCITGSASIVAYLVTRLPSWLEVTLLAILLKPLFSLRSLLNAVRAVQYPLIALNLAEARRLLSWHLVSRDTSALSEHEIAGAVIESLFENLSDSVIAPLLCFLIGGLPLVALYRFANTADAMWGYRTPTLEYAGKVAAHADDLLNLIPARITGLCLALASQRLESWRVMLRDGMVTASPNAGIPMAAGAGALGVRLEKRGVYALNAQARVPQADDVTAALTLARSALIVFFTIIGIGVIVATSIS